MNRKTILLFLLIIVSNLSWACDLCSVYVGIQPNDFKNTIGLRYRFRSFEDKYILNPITNKFNASNQRIANNLSLPINHLEDDLASTDDNNLLYGEQYNSFDIVLNLALSKRVNLVFSNSFSDNFIYKNDSIIDNISGVGDLQVMVNYRFLYTKIGNDSLAKNKFLHRLTFGGGVELPTGSFNKKSVKAYETSVIANTIIGQPLMELDPHIQPGTGSFNFLFLMEYMVKYNNVGWNNNVSYKINTSNKNDFRFANRFNANSSLFYLAKVNTNLMFMPNTGASFEFSNRDTQNNIDDINSGGEALFITPGIKTLYKSVALDLNYYYPIHNDLYGNQPSNRARIIGQISYYF